MNYSKNFPFFSLKVPLLPLIRGGDFRRLPENGPLDIKDYTQYLEDGKQIFEDCYSVNSTQVVALDEFKLLRAIATGGFGKIVLVERKNEESSLYAMKVISKEFLVKKKSVGNILNEKRIMQSLDCPFCTRLVYFSQSNLHLYFFMNFMSGGDVFTHLHRFGRFEEALSRFYAAQVVLALEFLQYCDIIHRDIKPENILIDHLGFIKITDFGFAKKVPTRTYTFCGTMDYAAPEIILGKGHGKAVDWWSFGILIVEMTAGRVPFTSEDELETFKMITNFECKMPKFFSPELKGLLAGLLQKDPTKRLGNLWRRVEEIKSHRWFHGVNWMQLVSRKVVPPFIPDSSKQLSEVNFPDMSAVSTISISGPPESEFDEYFKDF